MKYPYCDGLPLIQMSLYHAAHEISVEALVDSGSMASVLPYDLGVKLGLNWEEQTVPVNLGGAYHGIPAYGVLVRGELPPFPPMALAFAWIQKASAEIRTIVGHINFFQFFEVRFRSWEHAFELLPKPHNR